MSTSGDRARFRANLAGDTRLRLLSSRITFFDWYRIMLKLWPTHARAFLIIGSLLASSIPAAAQRHGGGSGRGGEELGGVELGHSAPDVKVYDAQGKAHSIRDLLVGHTTAIVFGCLT